MKILKRKSVFFPHEKLLKVCNSLTFLFPFLSFFLAFFLAFFLSLLLLSFVGLQEHIEFDQIPVYYGGGLDFSTDHAPNNDSCRFNCLESVGVQEYVKKLNERNSLQSKVPFSSDTSSTTSPLPPSITTPSSISTAAAIPGSIGGGGAGGGLPAGSSSTPPSNGASSNGGANTSDVVSPSSAASPPGHQGDLPLVRDVASSKKEVNGNHGNNSNNNLQQIPNNRFSSSSSQQPGGSTPLPGKGIMRRGTSSTNTPHKGKEMLL
jgi:hypothetical protein